jgi:hypothetical protein
MNILAVLNVKRLVTKFTNMPLNCLADTLRANRAFGAGSHPQVIFFQLSGDNAELFSLLLRGLFPLCDALKKKSYG